MCPKALVGGRQSQCFTSCCISRRFRPIPATSSAFAGFELDDRRLRRAGLDYHEWAQIRVHPSLDEFLAQWCGGRLYALSTRGRADYAGTRYASGDAFLFGPETRGLPQSILDGLAPEQRLRLPMRPQCRSLNLSNTVAVVLYEAWRQNGFAGAG